ncbi:MAG: ImmA/IrrE family metallo-endopeptidase [Candidatus Magasanikbacteria bacterium]
MSNIYDQAEQKAYDQRRKLGIDKSPIRDIFSLLEDQGIFVVKMPINTDGLSGAFYYNEDEDRAHMLINTNRSKGHQRFTAVHEYGHFLFDKNREKVIVDDGGPKTEAEKRADAFAANFLMPEDGVNFYIRRTLGKKSKLSNKELVKVKEEFGVSWQTLIYRLHNLRYKFDKSKDEMLDEVSKLNSLAVQMGYERELPEDDGEFDLPAEYKRLAFQSYFDEKISLGKLAEILRISNEEAKEKVAEIKQTR